ncbi:UNVERIFIED_CONTAM: hypothetical protein Scaly_1161000 [Sesamum calycinum]|uniref:Endonuclease/exonuclease/phosphatase domain-containing protein n=1 Tax=Sesamum calycinum TaxID=2727403 RepID=A0AAW2Q2T5_9LAMI
MALRKHKHMEVPIWIKLRHLPVEYWIDEGLSIVASGIGKPLYLDAITKVCKKLDFARVCVMLHIDSKLLKHIIIMVLTKDGDERPCKIDIEYEWAPLKCVNCMCLGHSSTTCPAKRVAAKAPVEVYVKLAVPNSEPVTSYTVPMKEPSTVGADATILEPRLEKVAETVALAHGRQTLSQSRPMKMMERKVWNVRGLNRRDHQVAFKDLISKYRLHFMGILETRVQSSLLMPWNWFTDYAGLGNRIWRHHISMFVIVIYGANDIGRRRDLWHSVGNLLPSIGDKPWLVMGDFNTVLDMSEGSLFTLHDCMMTIGAYVNGLIRTSDRSPLVLCGPDEYSAGFFKAAWPIIGDQAITKIIVQLLSPILERLISPSQNAFIPGRSISDNVLMAQKLFSGYNQCRLPPQRTLKVDLWKAYDMVEWDFLLATLQLFGFPQLFI